MARVPQLARFAKRHGMLLELNRMKGITLVIVTHTLKLAQKMSRQIQLIEGKAVE